MRKIHFVLVGNSRLENHLVGISRMGADEVVLFSRQGSRLLGKIHTTLDDIGVEYRTREITKGYFPTYTKATEEALASLSADSSLGVNMSTDTGPEISAIEDAVRVQLYFFHRRNDRTTCSAFRYYVDTGQKRTITVSPFWNYHNETHNDILEMLSTSEAGLGVTQLWDMLRNTKEGAESFDNFRKTFRDFSRWFRNTPCFDERMQKSPKYKINLL